MKILGIQKYEDAVKIKEAEIANDKAHLRRERLALLYTIPITEFIVTALGLLLIFLARGFENPFVNWDKSEVILCCLWIPVGIIVPIGCIDRDVKCLFSDYSAVWQYAVHTLDKNILNMKLKQSNESWWLWLDLEDVKTKRVSTEYVGPFDIVTQTNVSETIVDLDKKLIIKPYKKDLL